MESFGQTAPNGSLALSKTVNLGPLKLQKAPLSWKIKNFFQHKLRSYPALIATKFLGMLFGTVYITSSLRLVKYCADGTLIDYGIVSFRVVTTAGVNFIVDAFQNLTELENMKYHGFGTGTTAENVSDTTLVTELTTQYNPDSTRPTGTTTEGASANIYRTVATLTPDSGGTIAVTEHGVFSASSAGTLLDRSVFTAVNLVAGSDSLQATYEFTVTAGS